MLRGSCSRTKKPRGARPSRAKADKATHIFKASAEDKRRLDAPEYPRRQTGDPGLTLCEKARARPASLRCYERIAGRINRAVEIVARHAFATGRTGARGDLVMVQPERGLGMNCITNSAIESGGLRSGISKSRHCDGDAQQRNTAHEFLLNLRRPSDSPWGERVTVTHGNLARKRETALATCKSAVLSQLRSALW